MRQSQPEEFEHFAPSRFDEGTGGPDRVRPDWLTRVSDTEPQEGRPPAGAPPAGSPRPAAPRDPWGTVPKAGTPPAEEPSSFRPHLPAAAEPPAAPTGGAPWGAGPRDQESWEGAVERVVLDDPEPRVTFHRARTFDFGSITSTLSRIATSKPVLILVLALGAVMAVIMFRPREEQTTSIAAIRRHPERFEGRPVQVRGKVGEVFTVGGGYAFHLHQGRENIVVFTRSRVPVRREDLTISGTLSSGTLDGKVRQAIFETTR